MCDSVPEPSILGKSGHIYCKKLYFSINYGGQCIFSNKSNPQRVFVPSLVLVTHFGRSTWKKIIYLLHFTETDWSADQPVLYCDTCSRCKANLNQAVSATAPYLLSVVHIKFFIHTERTLMCFLCQTDALFHVKPVFFLNWINLLMTCYKCAQFPDTAVCRSYFMLSFFPPQVTEAVLAVLAVWAAAAALVVARAQRAAIIGCMAPDTKQTQTRWQYMQISMRPNIHGLLQTASRIIFKWLCCSNNHNFPAALSTEWCLHVVWSQE